MAVKRKKFPIKRVFMVGIQMGKGLKMDGFKESVVVSAGLTAPAWLPALNEWVGCLIGLASERLLYMLTAI